MDGEKRHSCCKLTIQQEKEMIKKYLDGKGTTVLSREYGVSASCVHSILKIYNVPRRTLREARRTNIQLNEESFNATDDPEKAYWLGVMYSDGYICTKNSYTNYFGISVQESDKSWLAEKFIS